MTATAVPSRLVIVAGVLSATLGAMVLAGWMLDIGRLKTVLHHAVEMKANAAVGLVMAGTALALSGGRTARSLDVPARILGMLVAALGLATLSQYVFAWDLGIDELLFR